MPDDDAKKLDIFKQQQKPLLMDPLIQQFMQEGPIAGRIKEPQVEWRPITHIREAYKKLAPKSGQTVPLDTLRRAVGHLDGATFNEAINRMHREGTGKLTNGAFSLTE